MFIKPKPHQDLTVLLTVSHPYEAAIVSDLLRQAGVPCQSRDRESGACLRVIGWGSPFGIDILINREAVDRAREVCLSVSGGKRF